MEYFMAKVAENLGYLDLRTLTQMHFYAKGFEKTIIGDILMRRIHTEK